MPRKQAKAGKLKEGRSNEGRFLPGFSGNPDGRPTFSLVSVLREKLQEVPEGEKRTRAEELIEIAIQKAMRGDTIMMKDIINRIDGMPKQAIELDDKREVEYGELEGDE